MPSEVNVIVNEKHPTGQTASPQRVAAGPETTSYRQVTRKVAFLLIGFSTLLFVSLSFYITASSSSLNIRRVDANMALHNPFSRIATALAHENASVAFLSGDKARAEFLHHNSAQVVRTDAVIFQALHTQYPHTLITTIPVTSANLLEYATAGHAEANSVPNDLEHGGGGTAWDGQMAWKEYRPPARRLDNEEGGIFEKVIFGKYAYAWKGYEMIVYVVEVRESPNYYSPPLQYLVGGTDEVMTELIKEAGAWGNTLHNQIWVFDGGYWQKDAEMYKSVQKAKWENVILDADRKKAIQTDVMRFFESRARYNKLNVPWKRGVIYYGPPGNGKTISIKALMNQLANLPEPVPALYVRSLVSFAGPQYAAKQVFDRARRVAPCILIFEDLDSIISDAVRSYFLNEVDGLQSNDGIFMVGSTNHLDRLDPGLSRRPSRFDRKYEFDNPNERERVLYCEYWRGKLQDNEDIEWMDGLSERIAVITENFSFAFMQEAFVASLLAIAAGETALGIEAGMRDLMDGFVNVNVSVDGGDVEDSVLWKQMKKQVEILRREL